MTSEVVLLISILCLIYSTSCGNYGLRMGQRHSNDQILQKELLSNRNDHSNETTIEYVYIAEKPVTYIQLHTDTNVYTEVTFINSTKIYIKLSNFENMKFNATLTIYGFPWHPGGPEPEDNIPFLLQPNENDNSNVVDSNSEKLCDYDNTLDDSAHVSSDERMPASIITDTFRPNLDVVNESVVVATVNFLVYIFISFVFVFLV